MKGELQLTQLIPSPQAWHSGMQGVHVGLVKYHPAAHPRQFKASKQAEQDPAVIVRQF